MRVRPSERSTLRGLHSLDVPEHSRAQSLERLPGVAGSGHPLGGGAWAGAPVGRPCGARRHADWVDVMVADQPGRREKIAMLWTIVVILLVLWLLGFIGNIGGGLIHLLLVIAVIVIAYNLITGRRRG